MESTKKLVWHNVPASIFRRVLSQLYLRRLTARLELGRPSASILRQTSVLLLGAIAPSESTHHRWWRRLKLNTRLDATAALVSPPSSSDVAVNVAITLTDPRLQLTS